MISMAKILLRTLLRVLLRIRVTGDLSALRAERVVIVANHGSFLDGLVLALFLPVNPIFVVHTWVAQYRWFRLFLALVDYVAVDPARPIAMKQAFKAIASGRPVVIFPEGRITTTGSLMKVYDGPGLLAARSGAFVVPVRIDGLTESYFSRLSGHYPKKILPRVTLSVLAPRVVPMPHAATAKQRRRKAGEGMRALMQDMLFRARPNQDLCAAFVDALVLYGRSHRFMEDLRGSEYSYGELLKMALALGRISAKVTGDGEHVGLLLPNLATTLCLLLGLNAGGRVPALLNYTAGMHGVQSACTAAAIHTVITSREFIDKAKLGALIAGLDGVNVHYLEDLRARFSLWDKVWLLAYALWLPRLALPAGDPERSAVVLFTSGSEGKPKGVVLSHRALLANIAQIRAVIDFSVEDKVLSVLPLFHSFGLTAGALLPLVTGTRVFIYPTPLHYKVIPELAYDRGCTVLYGTSTFLAQYAKYAHPYDFYKMRYVIAGAEKLAADVRDLWYEKFGIRLLEGYGATENAPVLAVTSPMAYRGGTVGQFLPGIEVRVVPVPGIEPGGLLHVRGPNLMSGYYRHARPGVLEPPTSEQGPGWYNTGDIVEVDGDGFVHIRGRVKRFAKIAGEMVSLEVVEAIAVAAAPDARHAATTIADAQRGEQIVLYSENTELTREHLLASARALGHTELAVPRRVVILRELPLLGSGKIDYQTLKTRALDL